LLAIVVDGVYYVCLHCYLPLLRVVLFSIVGANYCCFVDLLFCSLLFIAICSHSLLLIVYVCVVVYSQLPVVAFPSILLLMTVVVPLMELFGCSCGVVGLLFVVVLRYRCIVLVFVVVNYSRYSWLFDCCCCCCSLIVVDTLFVTFEFVIFLLNLFTVPCSDLLLLLI